MEDKINDFNSDLSWEQRVNPFHFKWIKKRFVGCKIIDLAQPFDFEYIKAVLERKLKIKILNSTFITKNLGIDILIQTRSGAWLTCDKKTRKFEYYDKYCNDTVIEYVSNNQKQTPGWIFNKHIDVLSYGCVNELENDLTGMPKIYWFKAVQTWFIKNKDKYPDICANNKYYLTLSKIIPNEHINEFTISNNLFSF